MRREIMWLDGIFMMSGKFNFTCKLGTYFRFEMKYNMQLAYYNTLRDVLFFVQSFQ